ncbi:MAG: tail fiber domain-containing protein [Oceanospirillaceae bacterium]|nr:tail fiber domain-containing protein [Oceanospirillaceae bacterium]
MAHARGTAASPAVVHYEDQLGSLTWSARGTTSMNESARINVNVGESAQDASTAAVTTSYAPTHFSFAATDAAGTGTSDIFYINGDGTVQIPALTSVSDLQTDANGVLINGASDARLKSDVADLPYGLSEVMSLRPVTFTWNEKSNMEEGLQHGFIAQEVAEVFPELVGQRSDGYYTVSYKELVPALTAAIQEQQDIISEQDRKLQELEARLLALENPEVQEASISSLGILLIAMGGITVLFFAVFKVRRA